MPRMRTLKHGFFTNDTLAEVEPLGRLLFAGLWTVADREGRLEDRPKKIKAEILPYDNCDVEELLNELRNMGFIMRYEIHGGHYIQIVNFSKHQSPHVKEPPSTIPGPEREAPPRTPDNTGIGQEPDRPDTSTEPAPVEPSGFMGSGLLGVGEGREDAPPPPEDTNPLMAEVLTLCRLDFEHMRQRKRTELHETLEALRGYMPGLDDRARAPSVVEFGKWFATRGFKDPTPSLGQLQDDWRMFEDFRHGKVKKAADRRVVRAPADFVKVRQ